MKRIAICLSVVLAACASAPRPMITESSSPPAQVRHMALGRLPTFRLHSMLLGANYTTDQLFRGDQPSGAANVACTADATHAKWDSSFNCFTSWALSPSGSTTSAPAAIGFQNTATGNATQLLLDWVVANHSGSGMQWAFGDRLQLLSYHGIEIYGARGNNNALTFLTGNGTSDVALAVIPGSQNGTLRVDGWNTGTSAVITGKPIKGILTFDVNWNVTVGANSCTTAGYTATGVTVGSLCVAMGGTRDASCSGSTVCSPNVVFSCYVDAANHVIDKWCNPTTASVSVNNGAGGAINFRDTVFVY